MSDETDKTVPKPKKRKRTRPKKRPTSLRKKKKIFKFSPSRELWKVEFERELLEIEEGIRLLSQEILRDWDWRRTGNWLSHTIKFTFVGGCVVYLVNPTFAVKIATKVGSHRYISPVIGRSWQLIGKIKSWGLEKRKLLFRPQFYLLPYKEPGLQPTTWSRPLVVKPEFVLLKPSVPLLKPGFPLLKPGFLELPPP